MEWFQALILGIVQGLTEFLPVSSSGHLLIAREIMGVETEGFLDFTVTVHFATVLSTIIVFRKEIGALLSGVLKFTYNDETDYFLKICVSMIPVGIMGLFFKDFVDSLFGNSLFWVAVGLLLTALLLNLSDMLFNKRKKKNTFRNGISYKQALIVGVAQAFAVAPGISRSGSTIATGLLSGVRRESVAQFSFLMVLLPIIGEQSLDIFKAVFSGSGEFGSVGFFPLLCGFVAAFLSGLFACRVMIDVVKKSRLSWFALYCTFAAIGIFVFLF